ncbi:hypothetical protein [Planktotalea sp.]|uniref:hypothetical protein n=1 Tax=Planktotalea sp. TaxID=2029877 RepID=UPI0032993DE6
MQDFTRSLPLKRPPLDVDGVIFVADIIHTPNSDGDADQFAMRTDLEKTEPHTLDEVMTALKQSGYEAIHMEHPRQLTENTAMSQRHVVLSTFGGEKFRSRTSWTPDICESHGIPFVGLDGFGQAKCHSKISAKQLAKQAGLLTPRAREYHDISDMRHLQDWTFPVVVKPSAEGSSIGISASSIVRSAKELEQVATTLFGSVGGPVMAEEFVSGREVGFAAIEGPAGTYMSLNEIAIEGDPRYFETNVWGAHEKFFNLQKRSLVSIDDELCTEDREAMGRFLTALGHFGYIRIDGRLKDGRFHFLEATPDAWLGKGGQMTQGFVNDGWRYHEVIGAIIETARSRLPNPIATD